MSIEKFSRNQYFELENFTGLNYEETFVDCGAYVGDTVERYLFDRLGAFKKIIAIEPFKPNYDALVYRVGRLKKEWALANDKIECLCAGVGIKTQEMNICSQEGGLGAFMEISEMGQQKIYAIDDLFMEEKIDFLKADIESFELDMLRGGGNILLRDKPKLAIAIYHNASDLYSIQKFLQNLNLGYRFALRHHSTTYVDTVLYAY